MNNKGPFSYPVANLDSDQRKRLSDMENQFEQETKKPVILIAYEDTNIG